MTQGSWSKQHAIHYMIDHRTDSNEFVFFYVGELSLPVERKT